MAGTDPTVSKCTRELRALVATALRDLQYFSNHPESENLSHKKLKKRLDLLWQSNQHIESVRVLFEGDYQPFVVTREALAQIARRRTTTPPATPPPATPPPATPPPATPPPATTPTPPSSTEYPEKVDSEPSSGMPMIDDLLLDDPGTSQPDDDGLSILVPFIVQHHMCLAVQSAMEAVCFALAQKHLPELLRERQWDCPEAASLPTWLAAINRAPEDLRLPPGLVVSDARARSILALHEAAVARARLPYDTLRRGVAGALGVVQALGWPATLPPAQTYVHNLCQAARQLRDQMRELEVVAGRHRDRLHEAMAEIDAQRAALDKDEAAARQHARDAMAEYEAKWDAEYKAAFAVQDGF